MAKIMLVEDDNNLREIYEARLIAEGYDIVTAKDGEEALALAVKEKPDLIISDVMMPKISGFDMLDILRTTPETKDTKIIMMTALSQAEDKARADQLGADRYLVKSQVTLEDVASVAKQVLKEEQPSKESSVSEVHQTNITDQTSNPVQDAPIAQTTTTDVTPPTNDDQVVVDNNSQQTADDTAAATPPISPVQNTPLEDQNNDNLASPTTTPPVPDSKTAPPVDQNSVNEPTIPEIKPDIEESLTQTIQDEEKQIDSQINDFISQALPESTNDSGTSAKEVPVESTKNPSSGSLDSIVTDNSNSIDLKHIEVKPAPPDSATTAADNAATLANAVNEMLQPANNLSTDVATTATDSVKDTSNEEQHSSVAPSDRKVIEPLNDINSSKPDLNELLAKEEAKEQTKDTAQIEDTNSTQTAEPIEITSPSIVITPDGELKTEGQANVSEKPVSIPVENQATDSAPVVQQPAPVFEPTQSPSANDQTGVQPATPSPQVPVNPAQPDPNSIAL